jgi:hypothetical protein
MVSSPTRVDVTMKYGWEGCLMQNFVEGSWFFTFFSLPLFRELNTFVDSLCTLHLNIWSKLLGCAQDYCDFGLSLSSGILEKRKHDVSETGCVSVLRWVGEKKLWLWPVVAVEGPVALEVCMPGLSHIPAVSEVPVFMGRRNGPFSAYVSIFHWDVIFIWQWQERHSLLICYIRRCQGHVEDSPSCFQVVSCLYP